MRRFFVALVVVAFVFGLSTGNLLAQKRSPEQTFAKMDKNGDKKLSLDELVGRKTADKAEKARGRFKKLDGNSDGFLTLDEYKAGQGSGKKSGQKARRKKKPN